MLVSKCVTGIRQAGVKKKRYEQENINIRNRSLKVSEKGFLYENERTEERRSNSIEKIPLAYKFSGKYCKGNSVKGSVKASRPIDKRCISASLLDITV